MATLANHLSATNVVVKGIGLRFDNRFWFSVRISAAPRPRGPVAILWLTEIGCDRVNPEHSHVGKRARQWIAIRNIRPHYDIELSVAPFCRSQAAVAALSKPAEDGLPQSREGKLHQPDHENQVTYMTDRIDDQTRIDIEAAVYRKLIEHLRTYPEVQNIDLMNLAYFCRNCLSKWYRTAAAERGIDLGYDSARQIVYGMPYDEYKSRYAEPASPEQLAQFETAQAKATE